MGEDSENDDEISALEEALYAQIHYSEGDIGAQPADEGDLLLNTSGGSRISENRRSGNRYFVEKSDSSRPFSKQFNVNRGPSKPKETKGQMKVLGLNQEPEKSTIPVFKTYTSVLQAMDIRPSSELSSTANKPSSNKSFRKPQNLPKSQAKRQAIRLEKFQQYFAKLEKADNARKKLKNKKPVETITLESSSEDNDDVIEIPVPPPPLVTIDDESDESSTTKPDSKASSSSNSKGIRISRCSSPSSSIVSDDFIAQNDKSRLSESTDIHIADEELQLLNNTVESVLNPANVSKMSEKSSKTKGRIPLLYKDLVSKQKDVQIERVEEVDEEAVQIVEPAAETPVEKSKDQEESVYSKGNKPRRKSIQARISSSSESDSSICESPNNSKQKKLRKRKSSQAGSKAATSSDEDSEVGLPYIRSGEAVSNAKNSPAKAKKKANKKRQKLNSATNSDNEFISMISTIAQGQDITDSDSVEVLSNHEEIIEVDDLEESEEINKENDQEPKTPQQENEFSDQHLRLVPIQKRDEWYICEADKRDSPILPRVKCHNCQEIGHVRARCKAPIKKVCCSMCGEIGHREPRCPSTLCLMCGQSSRVFSIRCKKCGFMDNVRCKLCRSMGHSDKLCPEKWRRYHSTVVDDGKVRRKTIMRDNKPRFCSACGRRGHIVEHCRFGLNFLQYRVATMDIYNYDPIYPPPKRFPEPKELVEVSQIRSESPRKSLTITVENTIQPESVPEAQEQAPKEVEPENAKEIQQPKPVEPVKNTDKIIEQIKVTISPNDERLVSSTTPTEQQKEAPKVTPPIRRSPFDSDSNYSFSDFYEKQNQSQPTSTAGQDFIPITESDNCVSSSKKIVEETSKNEVEEAKIFLSKQHTKVLLTPAGNNFLQKISKEFNISVQMEWLSIGNVLTIKGFNENQKQFHLALIHFLEESEKKEPPSWPSVGLPKHRPALISFLKLNLNLLNKKIGNVNDLYHRVLQSERYGGGRKVHQARRSLNMILMGQAGLRDGKWHLNALRENLIQLINTPPELYVVPNELRTEIEGHVRYIFSPIRHENYPDLIKEYRIQKKMNSNPIPSLLDIDAGYIHPSN